MIITKIKQMIPYLGRSEFIFKILKLCGPKGTDPVFRQCMDCKSWQLYDTDRNSVWFKDLGKEVAYVRKVIKRTDPLFPGISHGYCPKCEKKVLEELYGKKIL